MGSNSQETILDGSAESNPYVAKGPIVISVKGEWSGGTATVYEKAPKSGDWSAIPDLALTMNSSKVIDFPAGVVSEIKVVTMDVASVTVIIRSA